MLDVVALAMVAVVPLLSWSIYLVKKQRNFTWHRRDQLTLGWILLVTVALFEIDIRMNGWRQFAQASPYYGNWLTPVLIVHVSIAISTTLLWAYTLVGAVRRFPRPLQPGDYSPKHKRIARIAALSMYLTAVTGWTFYYMAFVA